MTLLKNTKGFSAFAIILFGLLVLAVVLVNGVSITVNKKANTINRSGYDIAVGFCSKTHSKLPEVCKITRVYKCAGNFILRSGCLGVGDIILNSHGNFVTWCGYSSLDGTSPDCDQYLIDEQGNDCTISNNLCLK